MQETNYCQQSAEYHYQDACDKVSQPNPLTNKGEKNK
jgi:hypothetical protein